MKREEFDELKTGDQVVYTGVRGPNDSWPETGTVITRKESGWLDDDYTVKFSWGDDPDDWHFFAADDVEAIKGELA